jgi:hypothetical protein
MDTLLAEVPHFPIATGYRIDHYEPRRTSTETYTQYELFVPLSPQVSSLTFAATKRCLQSGNHGLLGSPSFMADGVLTAEMMM